MLSGALEYAVPFQNQHKMDDYGPALEKLYRYAKHPGLFSNHELMRLVRTARTQSYVSPRL